MRTALRAVCPISVFALALLSNPIWAGRELPAQPEDAVIANEVVVKLRPGASGSFDDALPPGTQRRVANKLNTYVFRTAGNVPRAMVEQLARNPQVEYVEPNRMRQSTALAPSDPSYSNQWALTIVDALKAWSIVPNRYTTGSAGRVRIAVLDTGTDCSHADFKNAGGTSTDSAAGGQLRWAGSAAFVQTTKPAAGCAWADDHGHGTHVAGTIAAASNNALGVASLGFPVEIMTFKVMDSSGSGDDASISDAIISAADGGAQIISLSLGGAGYSQSMQDAVNYAWERNVLVVAAAGNSSTSYLFFPAGAHRALGVAATTSHNLRASYSNFGKGVDIAAPGSSILSTFPSYAVPGSSALNYATMSGTSMATPHVSAMAGLLALTTPSVPVDAIVSRMQQSANTTLTTGGWEQYLGYGIINAYKAVTADLRPSTTGSITGQAVDANNLPLSGVTIAVAGLTYTTTADGLFRMTPVSSGLHTLRATRTGMAAQDISVVVPAGADAGVTVPMGMTLGKIRGVVTNGGTAVANIVVTVKQSGLTRHTGFTDANGQFEISAEPGTYHVIPGGLGFAGAPMSVPVAAGATATANLNAVNFGTIYGTVRAGSAAVPGAQISFTSGGNTFGAIADAAGSFLSIGLAPGTYSVVCSAPGKDDSAPVNVALTHGDSNRVDCLLGGAPSATLAVSPASVTLTAGKTQTFTVSPNEAVTWTVSPSVGAISSAGVYTAPATITTAQTITVKATSTSDPARFDTATITLEPAAQAAVTLSSLSFNTPKLSPGQSTTGTVTLTGPAPSGGVNVTLASSSSLVALPASVTVAAGSTTATFIASAAQFTGASTVSIAATFSGKTVSATLSLSSTALSSLILRKTEIVGGQSFGSNIVRLSAVAPTGGLTVALSSSHPTVATVPASVTVVAGQKDFGTLTIVTSRVTAPVTVTISATLDGVTKSQTVKVLPVAVSYLKLSQASVVGGVSVLYNSLGLTFTAPTGGAVVTLTSSHPALVTVPATVTVAAGQTGSPKFAVNTSTVSATTSVTISATYGGTTATAVLTLTR